MMDWSDCLKSFEMKAVQLCAVALLKVTGKRCTVAVIVMQFVPEIRSARQHIAH